MISLAELEPICLKPNFRTHGNWMARRVVRPLALRITRRLLPLEVKAHWVTLVSLLVGLAAAACLAQGTPAGLLAGALTLQLWYLLDHVDGQVARYRGTANISGVYFDYLMHYVVHGAFPFGLGWGQWVATGEPGFVLAGFAWSAGLTLLGLANDCRYKAFFRPLKVLEGVCLVRGGGGGRPQRPTPLPRRVDQWLRYLAQKAVEVHVQMNLLLALAIGSMVNDVVYAYGVPMFVVGIAVLCLGLAGLRIVRAVGSDAPEQEFRAWFPESAGAGPLRWAADQTGLSRHSSDRSGSQQYSRRVVKLGRQIADSDLNGEGRACAALTPDCKIDQTLL